jgi:hypothetical protein
VLFRIEQNAWHFAQFGKNRKARRGFYKYPAALRRLTHALFCRLKGIFKAKPESLKRETKHLKLETRMQ